MMMKFIISLFLILQLYSIENKFLWVQKGDIPIILTAPHGGRKILKNIEKRKSGRRKADRNTFELTQLINEAIQKKLHKKPYVVAAKFSRAFLDVNRREYDAFDQSEQMQKKQIKKLYKEYHNAIKQFINVNNNFGILIDIHGQNKQSGTIFIGTQNGKTLKKNSNINKLINFFQKKKYKIFPNKIGEKEHPNFNGGYTVGTHGIHKKDGMEAIQFEFGFSMRDTQLSLKKTAEDFAEAIVYYYNNFLKF